MRFPLRLAVSVLSLGVAALSGCRKWRFPDVPPDFREYAYVANGAGGTVSVLNLVEMHATGLLRVGASPVSLIANPRRNEVYSVNSGSDTVSVIDAEKNVVVATIPVHKRPLSMGVDATGTRGYVVNSGSNSVSVLDLRARREIYVLGTGEQPRSARVAPDGRSLVVANQGSGSVSVFSIAVDAGPSLRASFDGCPGASDISILPDSSKAFVACSGGSTVVAIALAVLPGSWAAKQDGAALEDHLLARLQVGKSPVHLALKPDGGEIFVSNFASNSISEIATGSNEVGGSYPIGNGPVSGIVAADNSTLWVCNSGADVVSIYSVDDGRLEGSVRTGAQPEALAFSADEHLLLAANAKSGDVAVIRTRDRSGPTLFTMLPSGAQPTALVIKSFHLRQP